MSAAAPAERRPRLNPFVFPSETTFRFGLLVTAVLGASLYVWSWIAIVAGDTASEASQFEACLALSPFSSSAFDPGSFSAASDAFSACVQQASRDSVAWMLGGTAALVVVAAAFVLAAPRWLEWRRRLEPLTEEDAPAVLARLRELVRETGLDEEPSFLWNPLDAAPTGLAYGYFGRYSIALTGGLVTKQIADPAAFDAVVRHELAHIRNRDVATTYATVALWYAFLVAAVAPFFLTLAGGGEDRIVELVLRLLALAALVYGTRNAVLRSRELYADVRASTGEGRGGGLRRVLSGLPKPLTGRVARLRSLHPPPAQRLATLDDTRPLFRFSPLVAFGAGLAATIAYENVVTLVSAFVDDPIDMRFVAALAFAPFVVGIVGYGIWRATFAAVAEGAAGIPTVKIGLALAAGFLIGPELSLAQLAAADEPLLTAALHGDVLWALALVAGLVLFTAWLGAVASWWLRALGTRPPRLAAAAVLAGAAGVLSVFMAVFYVARDARPAIELSTRLTEAQHAAVSATAWAGPEWLWRSLMDPASLVVVHRPFLPPALVLLWALPLLAWLVARRPSRAPADWAFLDEGGELRVPALALRPLRALAIGAAGGLTFCALSLVVRFALHTGVSAETRATDAFLLSFFFWMLVLALLAQAAAGGTAAFLAGSPTPLIEGLAAGFVTGGIATFAIVAGPFAGGCIDPLSLNPGPCAWTVEGSFTWDVFRQVVAQGAVGALAAGGAVTGVRAWLARRHRDTPVTAHAPG